MKSPNPESIRFAKQLKRDLQTRAHESGNRRSVVFRMPRTVFKEAGNWKRRGSSNTEEIERALEAEHVHWDLSLSACAFDAYVCFSLDELPTRAPIESCGSERDLLSEIQSQLHALLEGGVDERIDIQGADDGLLDVMRGFGSAEAEVEYQRTRTAQRPDLVLEGPSGQRGVVELEAGDPRENSTFQVLKYMNISGADYGVLITARPSNEWIERNTKEMLDLMRPTKPNAWLVYTRACEGEGLSLARIN